MADDSSQLAELIESLALAKNIEAAAVMDLKDREADVEDAQDRKRRAEEAVCYAGERVKNAWLAVRLRIEAQTQSQFENDDQIEA